MEFQKNDYIKLEKIGIKSLLDLCLCIPKSYTDTTIISKLKANQTGALEIKILPYNAPKYGAKLLKIPAHIINLDAPLNLFIFHPKSYHKNIFIPNKTIFIHGTLEFNPAPSITQPKVIYEINTITPHFKLNQIKDSTLKTIINQYITKENLAPILPINIIHPLLKIFYPDSSFLSYFQRYKTLPKDSLDALKFIEIYQHILRLSKKRRYFEAKFICDGEYQSFIQSLPFNLTPSQVNAIKDIAKDLSSKTAARRIIMGDVGCGKTMVILCSVVMAYPKRSVLMVPTTILAEQIFAEAKKFLPSHISTSLILSQSRHKSEDSTKAHFLIGTQALLHQNFNSLDFALIMIDEQHRFGTNQRQALQNMLSPSSPSKKPHFLQFSATPIPRTLGMIESNFIDFSLITDLPFKKDINTKIIHKNDFPNLIAHIKEQIKNKHQTIIVYPLVEESEHIDYLSIKEGAPFWQKHFDNVYITHGQDKNKDEILKEFRQKGDILLATTLIEVGISLPRLTTIIILAPERLGLATLHQLRGRVSRNGLKGYCFLYTNLVKSQRLEEFSATLSGFDIAELDLKYRNSGDLLSGARQSGESFRFYDLQKDEEILKNAQEFKKNKDTS